MTNYELAEEISKRLPTHWLIAGYSLGHGCGLDIMGRIENIAIANEAVIALFVVPQATGQLSFDWRQVSWVYDLTAGECLYGELPSEEQRGEERERSRSFPAYPTYRVGSIT